MKTKEVKRIEAETRTLTSTFTAPEKPCCKCKYHRNKPSFCTHFGLHTGRKETCAEYKA